MNYKKQIVWSSYFLSLTFILLFELIFILPLIARVFMEIPMVFYDYDIAKHILRIIIICCFIIVNFILLCPFISIFEYCEPTKKKSKEKLEKYYY